MEIQTQTVEQFLFEQLEKIAPGKYTRERPPALQVIKRKMAHALKQARSKPLPLLSVPKVTVTVQDSIPALEPVVTNTKIRKARKTRKTQSRKREKKG